MMLPYPFGAGGLELASFGLERRRILGQVKNSKIFIKYLTRLSCLLIRHPFINTACVRQEVAVRS